MSQPQEARHSPLSAFVTYMALGFALVAIYLRPIVPAADLGLGVDLVFHLLVLTALVSWVLLFLLDQHVVLVRARVEGPIVLFLALLVASPFVAQSRYEAVTRVASWAADLALFYLVLNAAVHPRIRTYLFRTAVGVALAVALHGIRQAHVELEEARQEVEADPSILERMDPSARAQFEERLASPRPFSTMILATLLGGYLVLFLPALVGQILDRFAGKRLGPAPLVADLAALAILGYCLFLTRTRGAFLALGVGLAVLALLSARDILSRKRLLVACLALALALVAGIGRAWERGWFGEEPLEAARRSLDYRLGYWEGAAGVLRAHPLWGVGADNVRFHYYRYKPAWAPESAYTHNNYLQVGAELGAFGLLLVLAVWAGLFRAMARPAPERPDRPRPPAANHFAALPFGRRVPLVLTIAVAGFALLLYASIARHFDALVAPDKMMLLVAAGIAYLLVESYRESPASGDSGDRFRRRGLAAGVAAGLAHWVVDFDLYNPALSQTLWVVAGVAVASYRPPGAMGDVVFRPIPFLAPRPAAQASKKRPAQDDADGFLFKLVISLAALLVPWGLFVFKVVVPQFQASLSFQWARSDLDEAWKLKSEAQAQGSKDPRRAGEAQGDALARESSAVDSLEKVLEIVPGHLRARMLLGEYHAQRWRDRARHYRDLGKHATLFDRAEEHLAWVAVHVPGYSDAAWQRYQLYWRRGTLRLDAPEQAEAAESRAGRDPVIVAAVEEGWRDVVRAIEYLEEAIEWYPTHPGYLLESGRAHSAARELLERAQRVATDLEPLGYDPAERARQRYREALDASEAQIDPRGKLPEAEVDSIRAVLEPREE